MSANEVMKALQEADYRTVRIPTNGYQYQLSEPGSRSVFAEYQAEVPVSIRPGVPVDLAIPAYQEITADGDGAESTYSLNHSLADDPAMGADLVLYADGDRVEPASVNYADGTFTFADDGTQQTLDAFYLSKEQAEVTLRVVAPRNKWNEPIQTGIGLHHVRDTNDDPVTFEPEKTALDGVVPTDWRLEWGINAPYEVRRTTARGATADNMLLSLPVWKGQTGIDGLEAVKEASI